MAHEEDEFYGGLLLGERTASSLDAYLQDREAHGLGKEMRGLTDQGRAKAALPVPVDAGTRVAFITNIGSVVSYPDPPPSDAEGTVVMVRTAEGDQTGMGQMVFVKFDTGHFMAVHSEHLRRAAPNRKVASGFVLRVANLGDLTGFLRWGGGDDNELVHRATKDLWAFNTTDAGEFVISRLFNDTGDPLKI